MRCKAYVPLNQLLQRNRLLQHPPCQGAVVKGHIHRRKRTLPSLACTRSHSCLTNAGVYQVVLVASRIKVRLMTTFGKFKRMLP